MSDERTFRAWVGEHQQALFDLGFPLHLLQSYRKWLYFLDHGDYPEMPDGLGFDIVALSPDAQLRFVKLLEALFPSGHSLIDRLVARAQRAAADETGQVD